MNDPRPFSFRLRTLLTIVLLIALGVAGYVQYRNHRRADAVNHLVEVARTDGHPHDGSKIMAAAQITRDVGAGSRATKALLPLLASDATHSGASFALTQLGSDAVPVLMEALRDDKLGAYALAQLARNTDPILSDIVVILKESSDTELRKRAAYILVQSARVGSRRAKTMELLADLVVQDSSPEVRCMAASGLKIMGAQARIAIPSLLEAMNDDSMEVRLSACRALAHIDKTQYPTVRPKLIRMLNSSDAATRHSAVVTISWFGDSAIPDLQVALDDDNETVRKAASRNLAYILDGALRVIEE